MLSIGTMSGTSGDGVDVAVLQTDGEDSITPVCAQTFPYPDAFQERLLTAARSDVPLVDMMRLEKELTEYHAEAIRRVLKDALKKGNFSEQPSCIGFHGHTLRHVPQEKLTLQLGNPSLLAELTHIQVVADFRRRDMAASGEGAPLAALFHQALFHAAPKSVAVLNIGGVANITLLQEDGHLLAGDTGPGVGLLNTWIREHTGCLFDADGAVSCKGTVAKEWLNHALNDTYMRRSLPKSADRFQFNHLLPGHLNLEDGAASLCALTAHAVADVLRRETCAPKALYVCGGGRHHPVILEMLQKIIPQTRPIEDGGWQADDIEAQCFAWLAVRRLRGLPLTVPGSTACSRPTCGGIVTAP